MPSKQEYIKDEKERNWVKVPPEEGRYDRRTRQSQNNQATYQQIQPLKEANYLTQDFNNAYVKARDMKNEPPKPLSGQRRAVMKEPLIGKAKDLMLHPKAQHIHHSYTFSGTDNGIFKMTESINMTMDFFAYHLDLYNRYSVLQNVQENRSRI